MPHPRRESGEGRIGCIFWLLVVAAIGLFLYKWIPMRLNTAEFHDYMSDQAKFSASASTETLKKRLVDKAAELDLPVEKEDCTVEKGGDRIKMQCSYDVTLQFMPGVEHTWHYDEQLDEPIFIF